MTRHCLIKCLASSLDNSDSKRGSSAFTVAAPKQLRETIGGAMATDHWRLYKMEELGSQARGLVPLWFVDNRSRP